MLTPPSPCAAHSCAFYKEILPDVQFVPPQAQLETISSYPVTGCLGEEADPHLTTASFQGVAE